MKPWRVNLKSIRSERSQTQKARYCMISFIWNSRKGKNYSDRKQISGCQGWRGGQSCNEAAGNTSVMETFCISKPSLVCKGQAVKILGCILSLPHILHFIYFLYSSENAENKDRVGARSGLEAVACQPMFYILSVEVWLFMFVKTHWILQTVEFYCM